MIPIYRNGKVICATSGDSFSCTLNHPKFIKWLEDNRLTLEQWLTNNPEPVINKTVEEQRKEAYNKAWTIEEFQEAVFEHFNGKSDKLNLLNAKRNSIRDEIKKQKLEKI